MFGGVEYGLMPAQTDKHAARKPSTASPVSKDKPSVNKKLKVALVDDSIIRADACELKEIPPEVFSKQKLKELVLSKNSISVLPPAIGKLKCLRILRLDRNLLEDVPVEVSQLSGLQQLDLASNNIKSIPVQLGLCLELTVLNLIGNPLSAPCGGDKTVGEAYYGTAEPHIPDLASRDTFVRKCTKQLLAHLRDQLDPAECGNIKGQLDELKRRDAGARLQNTAHVADATAIQKALDAAERAGVQASLLSKAKAGLAAAQELRAAALEASDKKRMAAALKAWEEHSRPAAPEGQDYLACKAALRRIKHEDQARAWRSSSPERSSGSGRSRSPGHANQQLTPEEIEQQKRAEAETKRKEALKALGARSFDRWLEEKESQTKKEITGLIQFQQQVLEEEKARLERQKLERQRMKDLERGWPSRIVLERRPGAFTDTNRLLAARQQYGRPRAATATSVTSTSGLGCVSPTSSNQGQGHRSRRPFTSPTRQDRPLSSAFQQQMPPSPPSQSSRPSTSASSTLNLTGGYDSMRPKTRRGGSNSPPHPVGGMEHHPDTIPEHQELEAAGPVMDKLRPGTSYSKNRNSQDGAIDTTISPANSHRGPAPSTSYVRTATESEFANIPEAPLEEYSDEEFEDEPTLFVDGGNNHGRTEQFEDVPIIVTQGDDEPVEGSELVPGFGFGARRQDRNDLDSDPLDESGANDDLDSSDQHQASGRGPYSQRESMLAHHNDQGQDPEEEAAAADAEEDYGDDDNQYKAPAAGYAGDEVDDEVGEVEAVAAGEADDTIPEETD